MDVDHHTFAGIAVQKCRHEGRWLGANKTLFMDPPQWEISYFFLARKYHY